MLEPRVALPARVEGVVYIGAMRLRIMMSFLLAGVLLWLAVFAAGQAPATDVDWSSYGRDASETHYSPLKQVDSSNAARLGLAYATTIDAPQGNNEATPIMVNGTIYSSLSWGVIVAFDARTGESNWRWDPELPRTGTDRPGTCCGAVNRGVAFANGKIFAGLINGRLVALDANTGKQVWSTQTTDPATDTTITGAVRVFKNKVIVGTAGAEFNVRGYFSAYDTETGKLAWRFYTVPGDPSKPFEHPELAAAAKTWAGTEWWKNGGGGTVWDGMAYDADADLLYVGTGNGGTWNPVYRSPGGGDNLYLSSILADININGRVRKVIMQAPKNGFFYVLDRLTGEFISGKPYTEVNWAKALDAKGRPIENPGVRYENGATVEIAPGSGGGHNWQPMAFSPATGLVYIPGSVNSRMYHSTPEFNPQKGKQVSGVDMNDFAAGVSPAGARITNKGAFVKAWDPVKQEQRWSVTQAFSAGLLATAGNLVFVPGSDGKLIALNASTGERVWDAMLVAGIATPITYSLDGVQYVAVIAGRGGNQPTRLYAFKLDGKAVVASPVNPPALQR